MQGLIALELIDVKSAIESIAASRQQQAESESDFIYHSTYYLLDRPGQTYSYGYEYFYNYQCQGSTFSTN